MSEKYEDLNVGSKRAFLNEDPGVSLVSSVGYHVELYSYNDKVRDRGLYDSSNISFSISDCTRTISLDFDIDTREKMKNSLHKLNTIISVCESMKEDLFKARKILRQGIKFKEYLDEFNKLEAEQNKTSDDNRKQDKFERYLENKGFNVVKIK